MLKGRFGPKYPVKLSSTFFKQLAENETEQELGARLYLLRWKEYAERTVAE